MQKLIRKIIVASGAAIIITYISIQLSNTQYTEAIFSDTGKIQYNTKPKRAQQILAVQYALRDNNIPQAIHSMPSDRAKDLYTRGTLKTLRASQLLETDDQENYQKILEEAQQDFVAAQAKTINPYLQNLIQQGYSSTKQQETIHSIEICINDFAQLLGDLSDIQETIKTIQHSIDNQQKYIQSHTDILEEYLSPDCIEDIVDRLTDTAQALQLAQQSIYREEKNYQNTRLGYMEDLQYCLNSDFKPLLRDSTQTKQQLTQLLDTYSITARALEIGHTDILQQMCEQAQDDSLTDQETEQSLQQLINNLSQSMQAQEDSTGNKDDSQENTTGPTSSEPQYIPLTQEEEAILDTIYQTNKKRLETMMQIKTQGYTPQDTLEDIFEIFYGDTAEFSIPGW